VTKTFKASSAWTPKDGGMMWSEETNKLEYFEPSESLSANMGTEDFATDLGQENNYSV
jgi:hypothetical protein